MSNKVGINEGRAVGCAEGSLLNLHDGMQLGVEVSRVEERRILGCDDGVGVSCIVGTTVDRADGCLLGGEEGRLLGCDDGAVVS